MRGRFVVLGGAGMHRWTSLTFAALVAGSMAVVAVGSRKGNAGSSSGAKPKSDTVASAVASTLPALAGDAGTAGSTDGTDGHETGPFDRLPNGKPVPPLPASAPKIAGFGVILFTYRGAQGAPTDAPDRAEALKRAQAVLPEAIAHFENAVNKGDRGSTADAGHIPHGILEPAVDYALFSLQKGAVSDSPVDTPRGFWIVRRTD